MTISGFPPYGTWILLFRRWQAAEPEYTTYFGPTLKPQAKVNFGYDSDKGQVDHNIPRGLEVF